MWVTGLIFALATDLSVQVAHGRTASLITLCDLCDHNTQLCYLLLPHKRKVNTFSDYTFDQL
jgi:hypothetical protein